jgi:hypothetical protein
MVHRRINRGHMPQEQIDLQNEWEDSLEKDSKPKFKFPITFISDEIDEIGLEFPTLEVRDPEPVKKTKMQTVTFKKTKGGLF